jgi:hypothetical protein
MAAGELYVARDTAEETGFYALGNHGGSQAALVSIYGTDRATHFIRRDDGDDSALLPTDAISAGEILDELGTASAGYPDVHQMLSEDTFYELESCTVTAPADGYALVMASAWASVLHGSDGHTQDSFGVSTSSTSLPGNQEVSVRLSDNVPGGVYGIPVTCHGVFEVSEGANTFYFVGCKLAGTWTDFDSIQMSAVYIPSAYGDIYPLVPAQVAPVGLWGQESTEGRDGLQTETAAATSDLDTANRNRVDRELAELRAEIAELGRQIAGD